MAETMTIDKEEFNRVRGEVHNLAVSQAATEAQMGELKDIAKNTSKALTELVSQGKDIHYIKKDMETMSKTQKEHGNKIEAISKKQVGYGIAIFILFTIGSAYMPELKAFMSLIKP